MATRKRKSTPASAARQAAPPPQELPTCSTCSLFDWRERRSGVCRLPPPFQVVRPSDRCSEWRTRTPDQVQAADQVAGIQG